MTTDDIRQMCDYFDETYGKDVEHLAILQDRENIKKRISRFHKECGDLTEEQITEIIDNLQDNGMETVLDKRVIFGTIEDCGFLK